MKTIWIIGAGRFGMLALERLSRPDAHFILVDPEEIHIPQIPGRNLTQVKSLGPEFLNQHLEPSGGPDWIIPALPVHLAAEWCLLRCGPALLRRNPAPREIEILLPHCIRGENGDLYVTHADFMCPDNCSEPGDICTVTGKPRKQNMFDLLKHIDPGFKSLVIRSHQLAPGVGGYRPAQLFDLLDQVKNAAGRILVSTACRCHGVVTGMVGRNADCPPFQFMNYT